MEKQFTKKINAKKTVLGIYTEGFPPQGSEPQNINIRDFTKKYLKNCDALVCGSKKIQKFYSKIYTPCYYAGGGYDDYFKRKTKKQINKNSKFVVGWTGNPNRKFKHYYDIIIPAIAKAKELRPSIEFKTRFKGPIKTLSNFYTDVDVVLIASEADAGPSLFKEAGLMDVPAISTQIGLPGEIIINGTNGLIVDRNIDDFVKNIVFLYDNREKLYSMSLQIKKDIIKEAGKDTNIKRWKILFEDLLN